MAGHDEAWFRALVGRFTPRMRAFARTLGGALEEVGPDDIVQKVWVTMVERFESLEDQGVLSSEERTCGWLLRCVRLETMSQLRKENRRRKRREVAPVQQRTATGPVESGPDEDARRRFWDMIGSGLSDSEKRLLAKRYLLQLRHGDIASEDGRSEAAVRVAVHRALVRLREYLLADGDPAFIAELIELAESTRGLELESSEELMDGLEK